MKRIKETVTGKLLPIYRVLMLLLMIIIVLMVSGSIFAILRSSESGPVLRFGKSSSSANTNGNSFSVFSTDTSVFNGIGRLRIPVAGSSASSAATMIVSIAFPYPHGDRQYTEELASKITNFRSIANDYFTSLPAAAIANFDEESAKTELLKRYNAILRLGKIEVLYFNDLLILE